MTPAGNYPRPVLIVFSILAGAQVLTGGAALTDAIGPKAAGLAILVVGAIQAGMSVYVQGQVVPASKVVAQETGDGAIIAGPASPLPDGERVEVGPVNGGLSDH